MKQKGYDYKISVVKYYLNKRKMNYDWFMDYYAVRVVVVYRIETEMVHQISTK